MKKNFLRTLCLCFALLTVLTLVPWQSTEAATATFTDVPTNSTYYKAVTYLSNNGIINGYGNGKFGLTDSINREDMVTLLWRIAGEPGKGGDMVYKKGNFTDNPFGTYYYFALRWAKDKGLADGYTDGSFGVGKKMKNTEAIQFIYNFAKSVVGRYGTIASPVATSTVNTRTAAYPTWAQTSAKWAYKNRIATLAYYPSSDCTRGDVALMLYNYYKQYQKTYALVGESKDVDVKATNMSSNTQSNVAFKNLLTGTYKVPTSNITEFSSVANKTALNTLVSNAFANAKCIDNCYIFINCHGLPGKMQLYGADSSSYVSPYEFYSLVNNQQKAGKGNFTVVLEMCYAGKHVAAFKSYKSKVNIIASSTDELAQAMQHGAASLTTVGIATYVWTKGLSNKIYDTTKTATYTLYSGGKKIDFKVTAEGNGDGYVSLNEIKDATYDLLKTIGADDQQVSCHSYYENFCAFGTP